MKFFQLFYSLLILSGLSLSLNTLASGDHNHEANEPHEEFERLGPNGGKLLVQDHFALEVTMYDNGIHQEIRVFAYDDNHMIEPEQLKLSMILKRLDDHNALNFSVEENYWVSQQSIYEPHSFEVSINAIYQGKEYSWLYDNFEDRTVISDRMLSLSNIKTEISGNKTLNKIDTLFGVIEVPTHQVFTVITPYDSIVQDVHVQLGDNVRKGQPLLTVENVRSLQSYVVKSPGSGEITSFNVSIGNKTGNTPLLEISDLSKVWVNLSAFPENVEKMKVHQPISVYDLHHHKTEGGKLTYVAPAMTGGHIARARALIDNTKRHWRPGMHVKADVVTGSINSSVSIKKSALQTLDGNTVVFAKFGNTFEARPVKTGISDGSYIEIIEGLKTGVEYVSENSFVVKADILKSGASHDH